MARTVSEWIGKTDDSAPSEACKRRIVAKQDGACALTGRPFTPQDRPQFDHKVPLWLGGENRERNLHAIIDEAHKAKTKAEATVRAQVNARQSSHLGLKAPPKRKIASPPKPPKPKADKLAMPNPRLLFAPARTPSNV
ncbi:HNH endonuclease [Aminobacter aganoensis]|uniref:5-methylcytosine-specific restriction endonuclease McrA n=1 Tax=Aminobacter aganoensis TaxID=83264 RepID=A0A7X0KJY7_9HYPH|nr:HNH endonuclease [Aminobacter aganoensis]MBB6353534.1 5-methylcytosine-specific restriction endonuclease McrA [Aminobacter aganoensis]